MPAEAPERDLYDPEGIQRVRDLVGIEVASLLDDFSLVAGASEDPLPAGRGHGVWLWDSYGSRYLDMTAGGGPLLLGHCHTAVVSAAHAQSAVYSGSAPAGEHLCASQARLARAISDRFPPAPDGSPRKVLFAGSGREALALASALGEPRNPLSAGWEPQGVADETVSACRTGTFLAQDRLGFCQVTVLGESMAGGLPFGAVVAPADLIGLLDPPPFAAPPAVCAPALAVVSEMTPELLARSASLGDELRRQLESVAGQFPAALAGVSGAGTLLELRLAEPRAAEFRSSCRSRGLLVGAAGPAAVSFSPALVAGPAELSHAADALSDLCLEWVAA